MRDNLVVQTRRVREGESGDRSLISVHTVLVRSVADRTSLEPSDYRRLTRMTGLR